MLKKYTVEGMTCNHCVHHVTVALSEVEGVKDVKVSLAEKSALVNSDDTVTFETWIRRACRSAPSQQTSLLGHRDLQFFCEPADVDRPTLHAASL